ncbi:SdiA-regulated domain-containing protein [Membranihabitans marinus]|uniref:SdiA-regulated domain-containing protein n=1 Tax=Membranihabitans marinus TaxID=1227546 RepID=UPI001F2B3D0C|nr:SdiA-regulated domain-containing protein [Membranihabitans marinus]
MNFSYDLQNPVQKIKLPKILEEISGLDYAGNHQVYSIQDEKGDLFVFDLKSEEIVEQYDFGKSGDYEGVALSKDEVFALRSDGKLFGFPIPKTGEKVELVKKVDLDLGDKCDAEGLEYDHLHHRLLISCKGESKKEKSKKSFYTVNLRAEKWRANHVFSLSAADIQEVRNWLSQAHYDNSGISPKKIDTFNPSGLAIHPFTADVYILSSVGNLMVILSDNYLVKQVIPLNSKQFKQPEGITFDDRGHLYISNEGHDARGNIYMFSYRDDR